MHPAPQQDRFLQGILDENVNCKHEVSFFVLMRVNQSTQGSSVA